MLIPTIISLIISTIFLNFSLAADGKFLSPRRSEPVKTGKVLGASEAGRSLAPRGGEEKIVIEPGNLNRAIVKGIEEAGALSLPQLVQLPQLDQPMRQLPKDRLADATKDLASRDYSETGLPAPSYPPVRQAGDELRQSGGQGSLNYDLSAENGVILDCNNDSLVFAKRPDRPWPIASITKLFTALTFLDYNPGWETSYEIGPADKREGGRIYLFSGDKVTVKDLFYFSLVGSDNTATAALVRATGLSEDEFVQKINLKIRDLGLKNTKIVDPMGLRDGNISTAREIALLAKVALANEEIERASLTKTYEFYTKQGRKKAITNTNELLNSFPNQGISILGGKTGYVNSAGYCLVSHFKNDRGKAIITVILGADSDNSRFDLTKELVDLYYKNQP